MARRALRFATICLALTASPLALAAQERASLLSDRLELTGNAELIASGNVEIFYQGRKLTAQKLIFDQRADRLKIEGPILLTEKDGRNTIVADLADLSSDMSEGILTSARLVMDQQLQLGASKITRSEGRYSRLEDAIASSCKVCADSPVALWEIRASRVTHDSQERQIYFDHARFYLGGVPIAYVPHWRMPDPSLDRSNGFLAPSLRTTSSLGSGIKMPYFITLGEARDLTVTPYLTTKSSKTIDLRYRQAFENGGIILEGAVTRDRLTHKTDRGYFQALGEFDLPEDVKLTFSLQTTSDNAYLLDYGISDEDRLESRVELSRVRRNGYFSARVVSFQSLRDEDDNDTLPSLVMDGTFHRRFSLGPLGGEGGLRLQFHNHLRTSDYEFDGPDPDLIADGRDMSRLSSRIDWRRSFLLPMGIELTALGEAKLDLYRIRQDATFNGSHSRSHTAAGVELRWPWVKAADSGANHVIEPVVQLIAANRHHSLRPIEDANLVEFDEGNLLSLDRFPGGDAVEEGARANIGISWTRFDPKGWNIGMTLGRVFRDHDPMQFSAGSGLANDKSDWLAALSYQSDNGLQAVGRAVFDNNFTIAKSEVRLAMARNDLTLAGSLLWAKADPSQNRYAASREGKIEGSWRIQEAWAASFEGSYDFQERRGTLAGIGMEFRNECILVDLSLSRRLTSSTSVKPTTNFGLSVDLIGFGGSKAAGPAGRCY